MVLIVPNMCKYICDQNVIVVQRFKINVRIFVVSLLRCLDVLSNKYIRLICEISSLLFRMIPHNMCTGRASCAHVWTQAIDPNNTLPMGVTMPASRMSLVLLLGILVFAEAAPQQLGEQMDCDFNKMFNSLNYMKEYWGLDILGLIRFCSQEDRKRVLRVRPRHSWAIGTFLRWSRELDRTGEL